MHCLECALLPSACERGPRPQTEVHDAKPIAGDPTLRPRGDGRGADFAGPAGQRSQRLFDHDCRHRRLSRRRSWPPGLDRPGSRRPRRSELHRLCQQGPQGAPLRRYSLRGRQHDYRAGHGQSHEGYLGRARCRRLSRRCLRPAQGAALRRRRLHRREHHQRTGQLRHTSVHQAWQIARDRLGREAGCFVSGGNEWAEPASLRRRHLHIRKQHHDARSRRRRGQRAGPRRGRLPGGGVL